MVQLPDDIIRLIYSYMEEDYNSAQLYLFKNLSFLTMDQTRKICSSIKKYTKIYDNQKSCKNCEKNFGKKFQIPYLELFQITNYKKRKEWGLLSDKISNKLCISEIHCSRLTNFLTKNNKLSRKQAIETKHVLYNYTSQKSLVECRYIFSRIIKQ